MNDAQNEKTVRRATIRITTATANNSSISILSTTTIKANNITTIT